MRAVYQFDRMADGMLKGQANALLYRAFRRDGKLFIAKCSSNPVIFRVDDDGDGRAQRGEVEYSGAGPWTCLPYWDANGMYAVVGKAEQHWPITSDNSVGSPVLGDFLAGKPMLALPPRVKKGISDRWGSYITADPVSGGWYLAINDTMTDWGRSTDSFLVAYNADGTRRWITGGKKWATPRGTWPGVFTPIPISQLHAPVP